MSIFRKKQKNIFAVKRRNRGRNILIGIIVILALACVGVLVVYPMMRPINYTVTVEAGTGNVNVSDFVKKPGAGGGSLDWGAAGEPDWNVPGEYPVTVKFEEKEYAATVAIVDSTVPSAEPQPVTWFIDGESQPEPMEFVTALNDVTKVTAEFEVEPDLSQTGIQSVIVILTDEGGNQLRVESSLTITDDQEAPVIYGPTDRLTYLGTVIPADDGVCAVDDRDPAPVLTVDSSAVDFNTQGVYPVIYRAEDHAGNVTEIKGTMTVSYLRQSAVPIDKLNEAVDGLLAQIITDDMSKEEKCRAVYDWAKAKMLWSTNGSDKTAWTKEAYRAVRWNAGDSYTTSAFFHACMTRLGFEDMMVQRSGSMYYWNLVNLGDGWYHVDCGRGSNAVEGGVFMLTDDQLKASSVQAGNGFYDFDAALYPASK
ncbi:MAG: hypothetical protein IJ486_02080 [Firmicutes bacterium]|nr:hypothetical protein [Bacillota bacterium]